MLSVLCLVKMRIIGITGTIGAGKGTVVEYLQKVHGFTHFSARSVLNEMIAERKMEPGRYVLKAFD